MSRVFVRPSPGTQLRNPDTGLVIPAEGCYVVLNAFWRRRIKDGGIAIVPTTKNKPTKGEKA